MIPIPWHFQSLGYKMTDEERILLTVQCENPKQFSIHSTSVPSALQVLLIYYNEQLANWIWIWFLFFNATFNHSFLAIGGGSFIGVGNN